MQSALATSQQICMLQLRLGSASKISSVKNPSHNCSCATLNCTRPSLTLNEFWVALNTTWYQFIICTKSNTILFEFTLIATYLNQESVYKDTLKETEQRFMTVK